MEAGGGAFHVSGGSLVGLLPLRQGRGFLHDVEARSGTLEGREDDGFQQRCSYLPFLAFLLDGAWGPPCWLTCCDPGLGPVQEG